MYLPDLAQYQYGVPVPLPDVLAVGWLAAGQPFTVGEIEPDLLAAIGRLVVTHRANPVRGVHECDLCAESRVTRLRAASGESLLLGSAEIWIRAEATGLVYAAPNLIHHYITVEFPGFSGDCSGVVD